MQSCFHLDLALKLKGINIAMGGGGEGALRLLFRFGNRVLGGRGEISTECLNLFATACSLCQALHVSNSKPMPPCLHYDFSN